VRRSGHANPYGRVVSHPSPSSARADGRRTATARAQTRVPVRAHVDRDIGWV
jgi:hypothetical protein